MTNPSKPSPCVGIRTCSDYSPFGVELDGRTVSGGYRYGFQNQEKDDEIKGEGNSVNYTFRMHDPRLGRFFTIDPLSNNFPWNSIYAFSENTLIHMVELEGLQRIGYQSCPGNTIIWHNYNKLSDEKIEKALQWVYNCHQGNITVEDIKALKDDDYVLVTNSVDIFNNSTGTSVKYYSSRWAFYNGKPFRKSYVQDLSQWLYSKDSQLQGPGGVKPGINLMAATVSTLLSGGTFLAESTITKIGATYLFTNLVFNADGLTSGTNGQTFLESLAYQLGGEHSEETFKFLKLSVSIIDLNRGLHKVAGTLTNGEKFVGKWDSINNYWSTFDVMKTGVQMLDDEK